MTTGICSETVSEVRAGGTLRAVRFFRDRGRSDDLFGTVGIAPKGADWGRLVETQLLAHIPVRVTREQRRALLDDDRRSRRLQIYKSPFLANFRSKRSCPRAWRDSRSRSRSALVRPESGVDSMYSAS